MQGSELRKDAEENRRKLIEAAATAMRDLGGDIPLEAIAERAGVTRGTVYRNFEDRFQLYTAVLDHELEAISRDLTVREPCSLFTVMRRLVDLMDIYEKFHNALPNMKGFSQANCRLENLRAFVTAPLKAAKSAKLVRNGITETEILLACRMTAAGWRLDMEKDRHTALEKRFELIVRGIAPLAPPKNAKQNRRPRP